jgi:hypothetical protein
MSFLFFISGVAGGVVTLGLTGVFLSPAMPAVGFGFLAECVPSEQPALHEASKVDIHSR